MKKITIELKDNQEFKEVGNNTWKVVEVEEKWPNYGDKYCFIDDSGEDRFSSFERHEMDFDRMKVGNFFKTDKQLKDSFIYFAINSEWDYWHAGMNKPKPELDDDVDVGYWHEGRWVITERPIWDEKHIYRYKRKKYTVEEK